MIQFKDVKKSWGNRKIIQGFSHHFGSGIHCLLARNGRGKSTLLKIAGGVDRDFEGTLEIQSLDARGEPENCNAFRALILDEPDFYAGATTSELIRFVALARGLAPSDFVESGREKFNLAPLENKLLHQQSLGERKRSFLSALLHPSLPIWLMDEPSNGLDPYYRAALMKMIGEHRERGGCIVIATHDLAFADSLKGTKYRLDPEDLALPVSALTQI